MSAAETREAAALESGAARLGVALPEGALAKLEAYLALLAKWFYSSWRDGEWLAIDEWPDVAYRKLVNAIHRTVRALPSNP